MNIIFIPQAALQMSLWDIDVMFLNTNCYNFTINAYC